MKQLPLCKSLVLLALIALSFSSCQPYETPYGLEGMWQVQTMTDKQTGKVTEVTMPFYYCFQMELMTLNHNFITSYTIDGDSLRYSTFNSYLDDSSPDITIAELIPYGIEQAPGAFAFQRKGSSLTLETETKRLELIKY